MVYSQDEKFEVIFYDGRAKEYSEDNRFREINTPEGIYIIGEQNREFVILIRTQHSDNFAIKCIVDGFTLPQEKIFRRQGHLFGVIQQSFKDSEQQIVAFKFGNPSLVQSDILFKKSINIQQQQEESKTNDRTDYEGGPGELIIKLYKTKEVFKDHSDIQYAADQSVDNSQFRYCREEGWNSYNAQGYDQRQSNGSRNRYCEQNYQRGGQGQQEQRRQIENPNYLNQMQQNYGRQMQERDYQSEGQGQQHQDQRGYILNQQGQSQQNYQQNQRENKNQQKANNQTTNPWRMIFDQPPQFQPFSVNQDKKSVDQSLGIQCGQKVHLNYRPRYKGGSVHKGLYDQNNLVVSFRILYADVYSLIDKGYMSITHHYHLRFFPEYYFRNNHSGLIQALQTLLKHGNYGKPTEEQCLPIDSLYHRLKQYLPFRMETILGIDKIETKNPTQIELLHCFVRCNPVYFFERNDKETIEIREPFMPRTYKVMPFTLNPQQILPEEQVENSNIDEKKQPQIKVIEEEQIQQKSVNQVLEIISLQDEDEVKQEEKKNLNQEMYEDDDDVMIIPNPSTELKNNETQVEKRKKIKLIQGSQDDEVI